MSRFPDLDALLRRNPELKASGRVKGTGTRKKRMPVLDATSPKKTTQQKSDEAVRRHFAGKLANARGAKWEDQVKAENDQALALGVAVVVKLDPPTRVVRGPGGKPKVIFKQKGGADWIGTSYGLPVAFETKAVDAVDSYTVMKKNENQLTFLRDYKNVCDTAGKSCIVGYYVYWRRSDERRFHPIDSLRGRTIKRGDGIVVDCWFEVALKG